MATSLPKHHLLCLPREIRDEIWLSTMVHTSAPPTRTLHTILPSGTDDQIYLWSQQTSPWQPLSLLLVSHQIRNETQQLITHLHNTTGRGGREGGMRAELSIFAKGACYTPSFTYLNLGLLPASSLDFIVHLTILSTEHFRPHGGVTGFAFKTLLNFLSRFLFNGPTFLSHNPTYTTTGPFFLKTLVLNVKFQDDYTPATWPRTVREIFRMVKGLSVLDTAHRYIGKVRVRAEYAEGGEKVVREREWVVKKGDEAWLREGDWEAAEFYFGEAWRRRYAGSFSSTSSSPPSPRSASGTRAVMEA